MERIVFIAIVVACVMSVIADYPEAVEGAKIIYHDIFK
jgi:hypothetical protein